MTCKKFNSAGENIGLSMPENQINISGCKLLILASDPDSIEKMDKMLSEIGLTQFAFARNNVESVRLIGKFKPDVCIVDTALDKNEINVAEFEECLRMRGETIPVIYLTSNYSEVFYNYLRYTFPVAILNKDFSTFELKITIDMALMRRSLAWDAPDTHLYTSQEQFFFKVGDVYKSLRMNNVSYFYANNRFTYARVEKRDYPFSVNLKDIEETSSQLFVRIHKSYLVNLKHIDSIILKERSIVIKGDVLPIGNAYRGNFLSRVNLLR